MANQDSNRQQPGKKPQQDRGGQKLSPDRGSHSQGEPQRRQGDQRKPQH